MRPQTDKKGLLFCPLCDSMLSENGQNQAAKMTENSLENNLVISEKQGIPVYSANPSIPVQDGITRRRQKRIGNEQKGLVIDGGTGEIIGRGAAVVYEWEEVDKESFVKLFIGGIKKASGLSKTGLAMFEAVYQQMRSRPNSDKVEMSLWMASQYIKGINERTYRRGLRELLEAGVLYRSPSEGVFFVDITCMFNGDRLAFVKGYRLKGSQESLPLPEPDQSKNPTDEVV
jgi:hypothetical protein